MAIGHLYRYKFLVRMMSQTEDYALRHFPFYLASHSYALTWFALLPNQSRASWADLVEAFTARFHSVTIRVTPEQVKAVRPLECETMPEFIMRWVDTRLHHFQTASEYQMVQDRLETMGGSLASTSADPPSTFVELLKQAHEQISSDKMDTSCNRV